MSILISSHSTFDRVADAQSDKPTREISKERLAGEKRERNLWGGAVDDMRFLRRRGFALVKHGAGPGYCVCDGRLITVAKMQAKARRERRLLDLEPYVADPIPYTAPILRGEELERAIREAATALVEPENVVPFKTGGKDVSGATVPCALREAA